MKEQATATEHVIFHILQANDLFSFKIVYIIWNFCDAFSKSPF